MIKPRLIGKNLRNLIRFCGVDTLSAQDSVGYFHFWNFYTWFLKQGKFYRGQSRAYWQIFSHFQVVTTTETRDSRKFSTKYDTEITYFARFYVEMVLNLIFKAEQLRQVYWSALNSSHIITLRICTLIRQSELSVDIKKLNLFSGLCLDMRVSQMTWK